MLDRPLKNDDPGLVELYDWLEALVFSIVVVVLVFTFIFRIVSVEGESMLKTLQNADRVVISDLFYQPQKGDIVVLNKPNFTGKPFIKRVIALAGDKVDIDFVSGTVYVNGKAIEDKYVNTPTNREEGVKFPLTVPANEIFVMGDNRNNSTDSRSTLIGNIDTRYVMGRVIFRFFPFNHIGTVK